MESVTPEVFLGLVEIKDTCMACDAPAVAVIPISTPEKAGVYWCCHEHAERMRAEFRKAEGREDRGARSELQQISRTCGKGDDTPCGAVATHVAIIGYRSPDGQATLGVVSVCERHASG